jgi:hypothetical protein
MSVRALQCKPNSRPDDSHHDCLLRILFIFAKLNPGIRYVQGVPRARVQRRGSVKGRVLRQE